MAISSLPCIQPVRVPFKACSFFPASVCGGFNNKKRINAFVFSSLRKISNDINIESKIIYLGKPDGPTCHTGSETCYFTSIGDLFKEQEVEETNLALTTLYSLEATISKREFELAGKHGKRSWTKRLLLDENLLSSKIREEADELCRTLEEKEDSSCTASEMADVIYHAMSFIDLQFPNGQLTYVSYEGLTTSAFLPLCGGLLQAQGLYPGEMRYSFSCKNKWGTRITPMVLWPDKSFALGLSQALAWKRSGLMMKLSIQFRVRAF